MFVRFFFRIKSRRRLSYDVMYTSTVHTGHVHDFTDGVKLVVLSDSFFRLSNVDFLTN